ncbi:hypothetical protein GYB22_06660 [bacterium]|nr:hypothetical protein [bacterium]
MKAQTTLSAGDIAIVEFNADNPDNFAFVLLTTIDSGTQISFTDRGWDSAGYFRSGEGTMDWVAPSSLGCGEVVYVDSVWGMAFSASGDQIFAFQGADTQPNFITGINIEDAAVWQATASSTSTSALPNQLTQGSNATALFEVDNLKYIGLSSGTLSQLKAALFDSSNYSGNNSNPEVFNGSFAISGACNLPVQLISFEINLEGQWLEIQWQTASEYNNSHFALQESSDAITFNTIKQIEGAGTTQSMVEYKVSIPSPKSRMYYRLKQVDYDGQFEYSTWLVYSPGKPWIYKTKDKWKIDSRMRGEVWVYSLNGQLLHTQIVDTYYELAPRYWGLKSVLIVFRNEHDYVVERTVLWEL